MDALTDALDALDAHPHRVAASAWPGSLAGLGGPGLYAWWVDDRGADQLSRGLNWSLTAGRIYIGQAGVTSSRAGIASSSTLRSRIGDDHLRRRIRNSTLRRTLASILLDPLGLVPVAPLRLSAESEGRLSTWMGDHLSVAVWPGNSATELSMLERAVVNQLRPPLNLDHASAGELRSRLRELRRIVTEGDDELWLAPDPTLRDWRAILEVYGQAFDGYWYAQSRERECRDMAEEVWHHYEEKGEFDSPYADLRCALFWLHRCVWHAEDSSDWRPNNELIERVHRLYAAVQEAWLAEGGKPGVAGLATLPAEWP